MSLSSRIRRVLGVALASNTDATVLADAIDAKVESATLAASTLATPLTGFVSGAGAVAASSTILQAFNRLDGNCNAKITPAAVPAAVLATPLTGFVSGAAAVGAGDTVLQGFNKLDGNCNLKIASLAVPAAVLATPLTGFVSGAGVVAAGDTVLQGFNKLDGNVAAKQNIITMNQGTTSAGGVIAIAGMTATGKVVVSINEDPGAGLALSDVVPSATAGGDITVYTRNTNTDARAVLNGKKVSYIVISLS